MRRVFVCCSVLAVALLLATPHFAQGPNANPAALKAKAQNVPEIPYELVSNFFKLPADQYFGESIGVATNSKGHVYVYDRGHETRLFEFDQNGNFLRFIGEGLYGFVFAHVVRVDPQDNVWAVDEGSNMIIKFNPQGRVEMLMGRRPESHGILASPLPGTPVPPAQPYVFNRPTDVAWDAAGNIYISDGYGNSRVAKFTKEGDWVKAVGTRGNGPLQFSTPHGIGNDAKGNIYVADRGNNRIQVLDPDLKLLKTFTNVRAPWLICISPGPKQYLFTADGSSGHVYKLDLDGNLVGWFGTIGKRTGQFYWAHQIACPSENELYVGEVQNWRVQHVTLKPGARSTNQ